MKRTDFVFYSDYLEEQYIRKNDIHKCPDCGRELILHYEERPGAWGRPCFEEVWECPHCG